jgi:hypothetical protein
LTKNEGIAERGIKSFTLKIQPINNPKNGMKKNTYQPPIHTIPMLHENRLFLKKVPDLKPNY